MKTILVLLVMGILGYIGYSANKPEKTASPKASVVYYYPKANVYYDVATGHYIYFDEKARTWKNNKSFSEEQKLSLGERAIINKPPDPIWKNNDADRLLYSAKLYAATRNYQQLFREDSLKSLPKAMATTPPVIKKVKPEKVEKDSVKQKSGIVRFFERLFKGNKKGEDPSQ
jgi:hypothetical protein